jgi:hypothetical protein
MAQEAGTDGVDPVMEYTLLGDGVGEGLFAWIAFGVDTSRSEKVEPAVWLGEGGGVVNPDAGFGGPGGPGGPGPTTGVSTGGVGTATGEVGGVVSSSGAVAGGRRKW